ncbi:polyprenyl synthetase family protein [Sciscionella marina]|uniref:polyprenyl synthetase family protein n=1 Tax=Sciscionella marina TaxID=508770 RepID=UPI00039F845B|nr:class 1 isoprenoid biosynthesis enzyme [Sciscionella marina]
MPTDSEHAERQIRLLSGQVEQTMAELVAEYTSEHGQLRAIVPTVVREARADRHEFALPLLVHGAETGDPAAAVPIAAVHALWWRAANIIDDLADDQAGEAARRIGPGATMLVAFNWAYVLPARVTSALPVAEPVRSALTTEFLQSCTAATEGQLADLFTEPGELSHDQVLRTYLNKSSAPYVMASAMAARTAGADDARTEGWRRFGRNLGLLGQFRNDQEDLQSGRMEDLANATPTFHLVSLLNSGHGARRERVLALLRRARTDTHAREELLERMLDPEVVRPYLAHIEGVRHEAEQVLDELSLDELGGSGCFVAALRGRVRAAATPCELLAGVANPAEAS